jgi:dCTP deaminase
MVLSRREIIKRIKAGQKKPKDYRSLSFSPTISLTSVDQCSIDLRVAPIFSTFQQKKYIGILDLRYSKDMLKAEELWDHHQQDHWDLEPQQFVLAKTLELVHLPNDLMGLVEGKSTYARLGIGIHVTAPKIDPGYENRITLELTNHSKSTWRIWAGEDGLKLSQLILLRVSPILKKNEIRGKLNKELNIEQAPLDLHLKEIK